MPPFIDTIDFEDGIPGARATRQPATSRKYPQGKSVEILKHLAKHYRDGKNPNKFNYAKLEKDEIRLLSLKGGKQQEQINCVMFKAKRKDVRGKYEALSYSWGEIPKEHHSVFIDDQSPPEQTPDARVLNLLQDLARTLVFNQRLKRSKRRDNLQKERDKLQKDWNDAPPPDALAPFRKREEELDKIDELRRQLAEDVRFPSKRDKARETSTGPHRGSNGPTQSENTSGDEYRKVKRDLKELEKAYDDKYPTNHPAELDDLEAPVMPVQELSSHVVRLARRAKDIKNGPALARKQPARSVQEFYIRPNLYSAFIHLRKPNRPVNIWVDAICINQQPDGQAEKDEQLAQMAEIYGGAHHVCVWLGETNEYSSAALGMIPKVLDFANFSALLTRPGLRASATNGAFSGDRKDEASGDQEALFNVNSHLPSLAIRHWYDLMQLSALVQLLKSPWFSRRWIIQEIGMAKEATVHIGDQTEHWDNLCDAITLLNDKANELRSQSLYHADFDDIEGLSASILVKTISKACRKRPDGSVAVKLMSLEALVCSLLSFDSFYEQDAIYSVMALAADFSAEEEEKELTFHLKPSFKRSVRDLFISFVHRSITKSQSLDIICRHWAPETKDSIRQRIVLPTWISTIDKSPFGRPSSNHGRQNGENFVSFIHGDNRRRYDASRGLPPEFKMSKMTTPMAPPKIETIEEESEARSPVVARGLLKTPGYLHADERTTSFTGMPFSQSPMVEARRSSVSNQVPHDYFSLEGVQPTDFESKRQPDGLPHPYAEEIVREGYAQAGAIRGPNASSQRLQTNGIKSTAGMGGLRIKTPGIAHEVNGAKASPTDKPNSKRGTTVVDTKDRLSGELKVSGFILGHIDEVSGPMGTSIEGKWIEKLKWTKDAKADNLVPEILWQTLIAGRDSEGGVAPTLYRRACLNALSDPKVTDSTFHMKVDQYARPSRPLDEYTARYLKRVSEVILKRKVFAGTSILKFGEPRQVGEEIKAGEELLGLVPETADPTDVVVILLGCSVPVILRQRTDRMYELVGEAYVYGKMDGEAIDDWQSAHGHPVSFHLV